MKIVRATTFSLFLVANPAYLVACAGADSDESSDAPFTYGESDLLALLATVNSGERWLVPGYEVELSLTQSAEASASLSSPNAKETTFVHSAHACETRTFIKSASACIDMTELPVQGTIKLYDRSENGENTPIEEDSVRGEIRVTSLNLTHAELNLSFDGGSAFLIWDELIGDTFVLSQLHASDVGEAQDTIAYISDH